MMESITRDHVPESHLNAKLKFRDGIRVVYQSSADQTVAFPF